MSWALYGKERGNVSKVKVMVDGKAEWVSMDPIKGPLINNYDGTQTHLVWLANANRLGPWDTAGALRGSSWKDMTATEKEMMLHMAAKKNARLREWEEASGGKVPVKLPDFLAGLPDFIAAGKDAEHKSTNMHALTDWYSPDLEEPPEERKEESKSEVKLKPRQLALGEAAYNPPYKPIAPKVVTR